MDRQKIPGILMNEISNMENQAFVMENVLKSMSKNFQDNLIYQEYPNLDITVADCLQAIQTQKIIYRNILQMMEKSDICVQEIYREGRKIILIAKMIEESLEYCRDKLFC